METKPTPDFSASVVNDMNNGNISPKEANELLQLKQQFDRLQSKGKKDAALVRPPALR
jgi:hypothetical protein